VSGLVEGGDLLLLVGEDHRLALGAHEHLVLGEFAVIHGDRLAILPSGEERGFVDQVREIGAGKARCAARQNREIDVLGKRNFTRVNAEDFFAPAHIGARNHNAAIEAPGAEQRRIENVGAVGGGNQDNALVRLEAVHLDEQLVEGLLALIVPAAEARAAVTADSVDFIDEDDARGVLLALLEQVANARGAHADEHLDEIGTGDREERNVRFAGDSAGE
jgi:hypothetical protein